MTLIHQGKFRERANRSSKYKSSENCIAKLHSHTYSPQHQQAITVSSPTSQTLNSTQKTSD